MFRTLPLYVVDAFTKSPFSGNGAAVCLVPFGQELTAEVMQKIASEINLSETVFVSPTEEQSSFKNGSRYYLRWFTPTCEVALCGHATLATAAVLFNSCGNQSDCLEFETLSGLLKAEKLPNSKISINLPSYESEKLDVSRVSDILTAILGKAPIEEVLLSKSRKLLIRLNDSLTRRNLEEIKPDFAKLLTLKNEHQIISVVVTLREDADTACQNENGERYDFFSRNFAPWLGVNEDPVTGSAHSVLGPYWAKILKKNNLFARQCSTRGGDLQVEVQEERVLVAGDTCLFLQGKITF